MKSNDYDIAFTIRPGVMEKGYKRKTRKPWLPFYLIYIEYNRQISNIQKSKDEKLLTSRLTYTIYNKISYNKHYLEEQKE